MIDVFDGEIKLVLMMLGIAAIFGSAIGQHALKLDAFFVEEGTDAVVQEIGCGERRLAIVESATMAVSISAATRFLSTGFCREISVSAISPPFS